MNTNFQSSSSPVPSDRYGKIDSRRQVVEGVRQLRSSLLPIYDHNSTVVISLVRMCKHRRTQCNSATLVQDANTLNRANNLQITFNLLFAHIPSSSSSSSSFPQQLIQFEVPSTDRLQIFCSGRYSARCAQDRYSPGHLMMT